MLRDKSSHGDAPVVQAERQELGLGVVPVVLVPGDVRRRQELGAPQQRVRTPELDQPAACKTQALGIIRARSPVQ